MLLPAPFSPASAWTRPAVSARSTSLRTSTGPKRLVMPLQFDHRGVTRLPARAWRHRSADGPGGRGEAGKKPRGRALVVTSDEA